MPDIEQLPVEQFGSLAIDDTIFARDPTVPELEMRTLVGKIASDFHTLSTKADEHDASLESWRRAHASNRLLRDNVRVSFGGEERPIDGFEVKLIHRKIVEIGERLASHTRGRLETMKYLQNEDALNEMAGRVKQGVERMQEQKIKSFQLSCTSRLNKIIPNNIAEINAPDWYDGPVVKPVNKLQQSTSLRRDDADRVYLNFLKIAKARIHSRLGDQLYTSFDEIDDSIDDISVMKKLMAIVEDDMQPGSFDDMLGDENQSSEHVQHLIEDVQHFSSLYRSWWHAQTRERSVEKRDELLEYIEGFKRKLEVAAKVDFGGSLRGRIDSYISDTICGVTSELADSWLVRAEGMFRTVVNEEITNLAQLIADYDMQPFVQNDTKQGKRRLAGRLGPMATMSVAPEMVGNKGEPRDTIMEIPWLSASDNLRIVAGAVVDGRSIAVFDAIKPINQKIANSINQQVDKDAVKRCFDVARFAAATGNWNSLKKLSSVADGYPPIRYVRHMGGSGVRVYFVRLTHEQNAELKESGWDEAIICVGMCTKPHQDRLLTDLTGQRLRQVRAKGGGV